MRILKELFLIRLFSKIFNPSINKNIVCFGSMDGKAFCDNPKYLFLYLNSNSRYQCYWFTSSRELYRSLKNKGYQVIYNYSIKAIKFLRSAGTIITAYWNDYIPISFSKESIIVQTFHGHENIKKEFAYLGKNDSIIMKLIRRYDYILSPSKNIDKYMIFKFQIKQRKLIHIGYPRSDILFHASEKYRNELKSKYNISEKFKRIILYAPTYRPPSNLKKKNPFTQKEIEQLDKLLKETNTLLIFKSHFYISSSLDYSESSKNIIIMNKFEDAQELIIISDMLITDYSSIFFDFILMKKPVILFPYDLDAYLKYPGILINLEDFAVGPIARNGKELIKSIKESAIWIPKFKNKIMEIRKNFWDYHDGNSCKRFFESLNLKIN